MQLQRIGTDVVDDDGSSTAKELHEAPVGEARLHAASGPASVPAGGAALRRYRRVAKGLALSDALCVMVALLASYALRYPGELVPAREAVVIALAPLVWIVVFYTLRSVRPPAPVGPRRAAPRHRGLRGGDRPAGHGELLVPGVLLPGLGRSHLGAGPGAGTAAATMVAGLPVAPADGRPAGPADPGRRHLGRGQPARGDPPGCRPRGSGRSGTCRTLIRPSPPTGCPSWVGSASSTAWSGSMAPTACSLRPRGSPKPTWPGSRRWHARRRSRSGCWPTCRRCSPPGWRS